MVKNFHLPPKYFKKHHRTLIQIFNILQKKFNCSNLPLEFSLSEKNITKIITALIFHKFELLLLYASYYANGFSFEFHLMKLFSNIEIH